MSVNFENRIALNPALIVGLGGTGKKALMNFKETFLKILRERGVGRVCDQIMHNSPIGLWKGNRVGSEGLLLSVNRIQ